MPCRQPPSTSRDSLGAVPGQRSVSRRRIGGQRGRYATSPCQEPRTDWKRTLRIGESERTLCDTGANPPAQSAAERPGSAAAPRVDAPAISVLVVTTGDKPELRRCLAKIREQADPLGAELVLVINKAETSVDSRATAELRALCDVLAFEPRAGKSHGLNTGVSLCRGESIAFTDDDAIPQRGWLEAITAPLLTPDRPPKRVGTGGRVTPVYPEGGPSEWYRSLVDGKATHFLGPVHDLGSEPLDYRLPDEGATGAPLGVNCAYRREIFTRYRYDPELGPNTETGLCGGEDFELGWRTIRDGYTLTHVPSAHVEHPVTSNRMTWRHVRRHGYINGLEYARMMRKLGFPVYVHPHMKRRLEKRRFARFLRSLFTPTQNRLRLLDLQSTKGALDEIERSDPLLGHESGPNS